MPMLHQYPTALVKVACKKCARQGQYRKGDLILRYGASTVLPDVLAEIAKCDRHGKYADWCGAYYAELAGR